jgi:hypothetical protein
MAPHGHPSTTRGVPQFEVDLDLSPERRWDRVILHFKDQLQETLVGLEHAFLPETAAARWAYAAVTFFGWLIVRPWPIAVLATALIYSRVSLLWVTPLVLLVAVALTVPFRREVAGIARAAGIAPGKILLMQYVYEFVSACTSVVVRDATSHCPVHLRVMDWQMQAVDLTALVCEVTFVRGGRCVRHLVFSLLSGRGAILFCAPNESAIIC